MERPRRNDSTAAVLASLALLVLSGSTGCMHRYNDIASSAAVLSYTGSIPVLVVTHDQRPQVLSGDRPPNLTGVIRAAVGIPYPVRTASGEELAWEVTTAATNSLRAKGYQVTAIKVAHGEPPAAVIQKLAAAASERNLLITIREFHADRYMRTTLTCDLEATVYDRSGNRLAQARSQVVGELTHSPLASERDAAFEVEATFQQQLANLLNNPEIQRAFTATAAPAPPPPPPPPPAPPPVEPAPAPVEAPPPP